VTTPTRPVVKVIAVPSRGALEPVNVLLLPGEPVTLVDAGPVAGEAHLRAALVAAGHPLETVHQVILTQSHPDHAGLAVRLCAGSGARLLAHPDAATAVVDPTTARRFRADLIARAGRAAGTPADLLAAAIALDPDPPDAPPASPSAAIVRIGDRGRVLAGGVDWTVLHTPGPSRDHLSLYHAASGTLIGGDLLLRDRPTPLALEPSGAGGTRPHTLADLVSSWRRVARLTIRITWPGHGPAIRAHRMLVARRLAAARDRVRAARAAVEAGSTTLLELAAALGLSAAPPDLVATLGEVVAVGDWLVERGWCARSVVEGTIRLRPGRSDPSPGEQG